jgi:acid phosphatase type 7
MTRRRKVLILAAPPLLLFLLGLGAWWFVPIETESFIERLLPWLESLAKQPYVQDPSPTALTILYETHEPGEGTVQYTAGRHFNRTAPAELRREIRHGDTVTYQYRVRLESLTPGTSYKYRVVHTVQGKKLAKSRIATFRTWPDGGETATFVVYGDSRTSPDGHAALARRFKPYQPDFILHTGDVLSTGDAYNQWERQFFEPLEATLGTTPLFVARGNHDGSAKDMLTWLEPSGDAEEKSGGRMRYTFTCGPVHVAVLDSYADDPETPAWLDRDLAASQAPWKIVMYHEPTFDFGGHLSSWGRDLLPVLARHNVDVVLAGHSHLYERFVPLRLGPDASHATTFITTGGGGAELYRTGEHPLLASTASVHHYCVVQIADGRLTMRALTPEGREIDRWTVSKTDGRPDAAYLEQAQPVEAAIRAQEAIRAAAPRI